MLVLLIVAASVPALVGADGTAVWLESAELTGSDESAWWAFGVSVDVEGDLAVVGAPFARNETVPAYAGADDGTVYAGTNLSGSGAVYVYARTAEGVWREQAKLVPDDAGAGDLFGISVVLDGNRILARAAQADNPNGASKGAAYIFTHNGTSWNQQQKLTPPGGKEWDQFGSAVALNGTTAAVGAPYAGWSDEGAVHVYEFNGTSWVEEAKLEAANTQRFGDAVTMDGNRILVGAPLEGAPGAAYVYEHNGTAWVESARLTSDHAAGGAEFGRSVTLAGDTIVVGAPQDDSVMGTGTGAAYTYAYNGSAWVERSKLSASDGEPGAWFGMSTALHGDTLVVGAPAHPTSTEQAPEGAAYALEWNGTAWVEGTQLADGDGDVFSEYGWSLAWDGSHLLVGHPDDTNQHGNQAGSVHVFNPTSLQLPTGVTEGVLEDPMQDDAGTGGDASDDPSDPTMLPGGTWIPVNGSMAPETDTVDAYGTSIAANTTKSMTFEFELDRGELMSVSLYDPDGNLVDRDEESAFTDLASGDTLSVSAHAPPGQNLTAGTWTTVLTHEDPGPLLTFSSSGTHRVMDPGLADLPAPGLTYDGERECHPRC